jgi:hypothetical protein
VNKVFGAGLQITGGLLIFWSINDNLGLFQKRSVASTAVDWFKSIPIKRPPITVSASGTSTVSTTGTATVAVSSIPKSLEERIANVEQKLQDLVVRNTQEHLAFQQQITKQRVELEGQLGTALSQIASLEARVQHVTVGGFKLQLFGVLLAFYGAITSVYA